MVDTFAVSLPEISMQKLGETLLAAETNLLVHTPFKTPKEKLTQVWFKALFDRLVNRV